MASQNADELKRRIKQNAEDLKRSVRQLAQSATEHSTADETTTSVERHHRRGRKRGVNIAGRMNKAVVVNTGKPGSLVGASSKQKVRIVQNGEETVEESETTRTSF